MPMDEKEPKGLCSRCNRAVDVNAQVCPYCKAPLDDKPVTHALDPAD
jgi:predicted amidophosphoribosyltransferase